MLSLNLTSSITVFLSHERDTHLHIFFSKQLMQNVLHKNYFIYRIHKSKKWECLDRIIYVHVYMSILVKNKLHGWSGFKQKLFRILFQIALSVTTLILWTRIIKVSFFIMNVLFVCFYFQQQYFKWYCNFKEAKKKGI